MKNVRKTTIYDIAEAVGMSASTVSRVLSSSGYPVRDEVRKKIIAAAGKLNYTPNIVGRMLKKSESLDIGVIVPTISNPFYSQIILGIEVEARKKGYNILLCNSFRDVHTEKKYLESLYQKQVKGIIISTIDANQKFLREMQDNGVKIVVFDQNIEELKCSKVGFDFVKGGIMAVEYLIKMGHKDIAFLSSPLTRESRKETMEGYKYGLLKNNIPFKAGYVISSDYEEESVKRTYEFENGKKLVERFLQLKERPTAIFAVNDITAFGIIQGLSASGLSVPEDISVIGFDNIELASMINPPLTTIEQPSFETGKLACRMLLERLSDSEYADFSIKLEPTLIERESVKIL